MISSCAHFPFEATEFALALSESETFAIKVKEAATAWHHDGRSVQDEQAANLLLFAVKTACSRLQCASSALRGSRLVEAVSGEAAAASGSCLCAGASYVATLNALRGGLACVRLLRSACALGPEPADEVVTAGGLASALSLLDFLGCDGELRGTDDNDSENAVCVGDDTDWPSTSRIAVKACLQLLHNACARGQHGTAARGLVWTWLLARSSAAARAAPLGSLLRVPQALARWGTDDRTTVAVAGWLVVRLAEADARVARALADADAASDLLAALLRLAAPAPGTSSDDVDVDWAAQLSVVLALSGALGTTWRALAPKQAPMNAFGYLLSVEQLALLHALALAAEAPARTPDDGRPGSSLLPLAPTDAALFWAELARLVASLSAAPVASSLSLPPPQDLSPNAAARRAMTSAGVSQLARLLADDLAVDEPAARPTTSSAAVRGSTGDEEDTDAEYSRRAHTLEALCALLASEAASVRAAMPRRADGRPGRAAAHASAFSLSAVDCTRLVTLALGRAAARSPALGIAAADALATACPAFVTSCLERALVGDASAPTLREWSALCLRTLARAPAASAVIERLRASVAASAAPTVEA